ncbi:NADPH:quinone oxidoreductase family protein [Fibrella forsythiae]|uniref:NADPH:quinone oxidoreductase family protein n=1 Tax=Fibrella forsythiae TaxID=2817061 RepID=A0ABS3JE32_9BACT|nr:NADPH:quinone oxidoreductase family protein [Fibrella forsythiae]MBO0948260.1 NADPH:quinone oxidoreductase family protein [Fibrella forsythiae]
MKAVLCRQFGPPDSLTVDEVARPQATPGTVVIDVKACGVNFPDTLIIEGKYQFRPDFPFSPGGEVAGIVREVGEGVSHVKPGDNVFALTGWGGFAESVLADAFKTFLMPDKMEYTTAASLMYTYGTSYHALKQRAQLRSGRSGDSETLLVLGAAGGVGLAAVTLGKLMGARVIAAASTDEKLALCRQYGADELINYTSQPLRDRLLELVGKKGVDVVYDPVGGELAEPALRSMAWGGRYLVVGFAAGSIPSLPFNLPLLKGCSVVGVFWGAFAERQPKDNQQNVQELLQFWQRGQLIPHIHATYPLEQAANALNDMLGRRVMGKALIVV